MLRRHGALLVTGAIPPELCTALAAHLREVSSTTGAATGVTDGGTGGTGSAPAAPPPYDTTHSTHARSRRRHVAVSLSAPAVAAVLDELGALLHPLVCAAALGSGADDCPPLRLVESGLLVSSPGAPAQPLHADTDGGVRPREALAFKVQLAASRVTAAMGPIELRTGSGRGEAVDGGGGEAVDAQSRALPVPLPAGSILLYDTRLWHRGGANRSKRRRPVFYVTVLGPRGAAPAGLPYTIEPEQAAGYALDAAGVVGPSGESAGSDV